MKEQLDPKELGIKFIRGCEVKRVLDEEKNVIGERKKDGSIAVGVGDMRTFRVELDTAQYQQDMTSVVDGADDVYTTFNLLVKRQAKENNFKAVLETIRNLMSRQFSIPDWLHNVFLGYGDPGSATYKSVYSPTWKLKFADTFLNFEHLKSCFKDYKTTLIPDVKDKNPTPPYEIEFLDQKKLTEKHDAKAAKDNGGDAKIASSRNEAKNSKGKAELIVKPYDFGLPGPYSERETQSC